MKVSRGKVSDKEFEREIVEYFYDIVAWQRGLPDFEQYKKVCKKQCSWYKGECNPRNNGDIYRMGCPLVYANYLPAKKPKTP